MPLYFVHADGCSACAAAEPELSAFEQAHPFVMVVRLHADGVIAERMGLKVKATPTYLWHEAAEETEVRVGLLKAKDLEKWWKAREAEPRGATR